MFNTETPPRTKSLLAIPAILAAVAIMIGCSHPLEVDLPSGYSGDVVVLCDELTGFNRPISVGVDGRALHVACPRSRQKLVIVRDGVQILPKAEPKWETTGDGILLGIEFRVE